MVGLGCPFAAHVNVTLTPNSAVTFCGGVTISGENHSGSEGAGWSSAGFSVGGAWKNTQKAEENFQYLIEYVQQLNKETLLALFWCAMELLSLSLIHELPRLQNRQKFVQKE